MPPLVPLQLHTPPAVGTFLLAPPPDATAEWAGTAGPLGKGRHWDTGSQDERGNGGAFGDRFLFDGEMYLNLCSKAAERKSLWFTKSIENRHSPPLRKGFSRAAPSSSCVTGIAGWAGQGVHLGLCVGVRQTDRQKLVTVRLVQKSLRFLRLFLTF